MKIILKRIALLSFALMLTIPSFQKADDFLFYKFFCGTVFFVCVGVVAIKSMELAQTKKQILETLKELQKSQINHEEFENLKKEVEELKNKLDNKNKEQISVIQDKPDGNAWLSKLNAV